MRTIRFTGFLMTCILSLLGAGRLEAQPVVSGGVSDDLFRLRPGRGMRVSSSDPNWQNGNADNRKILPGQTLTIADIDGPGIIRHIWFTFSAQDPRYGRSLVLRIYWDGQEEPAVESPIGDFFAVGHGLKRYVNSQMVSVTSEGRAYNCYWPMPFAKHARITLTNDAKKERIKAVYFYVDYEKVPELPSDTAAFHAQYRQEYPAKAGRNYLILDTEGRGHYVGTVLSVYSRTRGWFGEGDDFFYVDGEAEPSLRGTGTEDYFCDGWGFRVFARPYYGVVVFDGYGIGDRVSVYRWHIPDPVRFSRSLKVEIEHRGEMNDESGKTFTGFYERPDLFSSVAFWYQSGKARRFAKVPPLSERVVPQSYIECGSQIKDVKATPSSIVIQPHRGDLGGDGILARCDDPASQVIVPFKLDEPASGVARLMLSTFPEGGIWSIKLDDKPVAGADRVDTYAPTGGERELRVGMVDLATGQHTLTFESKGRAAAARACWLAISTLTIDHITAVSAKAETK